MIVRKSEQLLSHRILEKVDSYAEVGPDTVGMDTPQRLAVGLDAVTGDTAAECMFAVNIAAESSGANTVAAELVVMGTAAAAADSWRGCFRNIADVIEAVDNDVLAGIVGFADNVVMANTEGTGTEQP